MFTGIIEKLGRVESRESLAGQNAVRFLIATGFSDLELGESVAINGTCLTVTERDPSGMASFFVSSESLDRTNLGALVPGAVVNLERAMLLGARLSGHLVQGHVDGLARLTSITPLNEAHELSFEIPSSLARYCVEKGSITLDGISLTINSVTTSTSSEEGALIRVMIIPHTWTHTRLSSLRVGDHLNVEVDVIAKYVERLTQTRSGELHP